tara:strand:- start:87 stop:2285 length:2199 start_codon:yes stop_codon:yes gene_type:complete
VATTKITSPDLFNLDSLNTELRLPSGTTAQRPTSPSAGEWRFNTSNNLLEMFDGSNWFSIQDKVIPPLPSDNFNAVLYNGTSATHAITGVGFAPDLVWTKDRNNAEQHQLHDTSRGATKALAPNLTNAEATRVDGLTSFDSNGFTLGADGAGIINDSARGPYVAWCWKVNGGTTASNTDGSIASTVQVNNKIGISIVQYTGTQANATVGHGLSTAPDLVITKGLNINAGWPTLVQADATTRFDGLRFNEDGQNQAGNGAGFFQNTSPTQSVFYLGNSDESNRSGGATIAYCFASIAGYSSIGTYTGNGSSKAINTGFQTAFLIIKRTSGSGDWRVYDNKRGSGSVRYPLYANLNNTEGGGVNEITFLSNGFQAGSATNVNDNGQTYIYIAFAADASTAPTLADSFANKLYTGTGVSGLNITGLGFSPSLVWIKSRDVAREFILSDSVRGPNREISSNDSSAEEARGVSVFTADGFTLDAASLNYNGAGENYVSWNWKANSVPTINTDGTNQSVVSANQSSGFSIVQGTASGGLNTVNSFGHGLGVKPDLIIIKSTTSVDNWYVYNSISGAGKSLYLNDSAAEFSTTNVWANTEPTASVFSIKDGQTVSVGATFIAYCFKSISGFSKIGSYVGGGNTNPAVNVGFTPDWLMVKKATGTTTGSDGWTIVDSARHPGTPTYENGNVLYANDNLAEQDDDNQRGFIITSTGFSPNGNYSPTNNSGDTYIYMAFKEN